MFPYLICPKAAMYMSTPMSPLSINTSPFCHCPHCFMYVITSQKTHEPDNQCFAPLPLSPLSYVHHYEESLMALHASDRSTSLRELRPTLSSTRLLTTSSSSVSQVSHAGDSNGVERMERHSKEAGLTQGPHGGQEHLLTPSGIAAEQR